jgi:tetratricopeptide (TPR) repeat protein
MKTKKTKQIKKAPTVEPLWPYQLSRLSRDEAEQRASAVADNPESDPHFCVEVAGDICLVAGELADAMGLYRQCQFGESQAASRRNSKVAHCLLHLKGADNPMGALKEAMEACSAVGDVAESQTWLWLFYMQAGESAQHGQALLTYHGQLIAFADDEEARRVLLVMTAHHLVKSDVATALEMATQAGAGGPTIFPKTEYREHERISWDIPLSAIRVRIKAAMHTGNAEDLARAIGDLNSVILAHPSELPAALYAFIGFQIGTHRYFDDTDLAEHQVLDRLMAAASDEQQALLALASVFHDREYDNSVRLAPLRDTCDLIQQPILRALADALVAEGGRNLTTFAKAATAVDCYRATYPQLLESVVFDLASKVKSGKSAEEVVRGYVAALEEAHADGIAPDNNIFDDQLYDALLEGTHYHALLDAAQAWRATGKGGGGAAFQVGVARHLLGNLDAAAECYRETLVSFPDHRAALDNLRTIASHKADVETLKELQAAVAAAAERHVDDQQWSKLAEAIATSLKAAEDTRTIEKRLQEVGEGNRNRSIDYSTIPDDIAVILLALDRTLGGQALERTFFRTDCASLAPMDSGTFISKLWEARVIADDPAKAKKDAYFLKGSELWHHNDKVAYLVVPDENCENRADSMMMLNGRQFTDAGRLRELWLTYATTDCVAYLYAMMGEHQLELDKEKDAEIRAAIRTALQDHSVSEIWSVIWKIERDAGELAQRHYYNEVRAAATIPGKFSRHLESVVKGKRQFGNWKRPSYQPAGTIGQVFYELFGIDEETRGSELASHLPDTAAGEPGLQINLTHELRTDIDCVLARVQRRKQGPDMMAAFASAIADGMPFEDAVDYLDRRFSEDEPGE